MNPFKKASLVFSIALFSCLLFAFTQNESTQYKCMIQLVNYTGEGAYVVISLINPEGEYEKTLYVMGDDDEWYHDISEWWRFYGKKRSNIDAITGATIGGGERATSTIKIENEKINSGYSIRFETAVEDKEYYVTDLEFPLTTENVSGKHLGSGYIRYIRIIPN